MIATGLRDVGKTVLLNAFEGIAQQARFTTAFSEITHETPTTITGAILKSLGFPTRAPPIAPARPVSPDWTMAEPSAKRGHFSNYGSRPAA